MNNIEDLKRLASAIRITHDWWSESVSEAIPAVFYRAGGIEWAVVATQEIPKCAIPEDCDKHTFPALERARISNYVAAANPAAVLELIAEVEYLRGKNREHFDACIGCDEELKRVTKQRDELLAAMDAIIALPSHPMRKKAVDIAVSAKAKAEG